MADLDWMDWDNPQDSEDVSVDSGVLSLASSIPDSEANQKLIHRWTLAEASAPFADSIGSADSTSVTGTTQVTGDWIGGAAREGDGSDDVIETTTWGSFGSDMDSDWAIAFSISGSFDTSGYVSGAFDDDESTLFNLTTGVAGNVNGGLGLRLKSDDDTMGEVSTASSYNDGNPHRIVINKTSNSTSGVEVWADQTDDTEENTSASWGSFSDFSVAVPFFARKRADGTLEGHTAAVIDDWSVFGSSLTQSEIESYQNPWS